MTVDHKELAHALARAEGELDPAAQRVALALYRLLAEGAPVGVERLAGRAGSEPAAVARLLEDWPGVYFDDGHVVGFSGLALSRMPHRLQVDGRELRAWCAWDTLFLPELIGEPARVESQCPVTETTISLAVSPATGVSDLRPEAAVLSLLRPKSQLDAEVITSFCHFVHFFRNEPAAREWTARHEGTFSLSVEAGFDIGQLVNRERFGDVLPEAVR